MIIVQLGANKGNDKLTEYIKKNNIKLDLAIFVEPIPFHVEDLKECYKDYPNVVVENVAIKLPNDIRNQMDLFYHLDDGPNYEVTSFDWYHVYKHYNNDNIGTIQVPSLSLEELFDKYNLKRIDWLLIDVEGLDEHIVKTINWEKYDIQRIDVEHIHWDEQNREQIFENFYNMGYKHVVANDDRYDVAFEKIKKENTTLKKLDVYANGQFIGWIPKQNNNWWLDEEIEHSFNYFDLVGFYNEDYLKQDHVPDVVVNNYFNYITEYYKLITGNELTSILEFGSAGGWFTKKFYDNGVDIIGLEGSLCGVNATIDKGVPPERIIKHDFRNPVNLGRKFDIVCCTEVAEHVEIPFAGTLIKSLVDHSDLIWFSSVPPYSIKLPSNYHHVNEQPEKFWINLFKYFDYDYFKLPDFVYNDTNLRGRFIFYNKNVYNKEVFTKDLYSHLNNDELLTKFENGEISRNKFLELINKKDV